MLIISMLKAQQLGLFDSIVHVGTIVRKDGTVVAAHNRHVKKRAEEQHPQGELVLQDENKQTKLSKLDATIQKFGGQKGVANLIATAPKAVSDQIVALLAKLSKKTEDEIRTQYPAPAPKPAQPAQPTEQPEVKEDAKPENEPEALPEKQADTPWNIVEHVTKGGKGKTIRGIIRTDLTYAEAKAIDEYTFKKDGGYFIREKHLPTMKAEARITSAVATGAITEEQAAVAKEAMQSGGIQAAAEAIADKRTIQAAKLRKGAQATIEKAQAEQNRDRLTNTHKRAREAGSAIARANKEEAIGNTMLNLADAIESGQAVHLSGVDSKAAVETLDRLIGRAIYETDRKLPYQEQERNKGRAPTQTDIDNAVMPRVTAWGSQIEDVADILQTKAPKGNSRLIQQIRKLAGRRRDAAFELDKDEQAMVMDAHKKASAVGRPYSMDHTFDQIKEVNRLNRLGITDNITLRDALTEFVQFRDGVKAEDPVKAAERALVGQKVGVDFFPTPKPLAKRMAEIAGVKPGMKVLEPSAGNGNLADAAKEAGADVDVLEISPQLQNVLQLKGHNLVGHDFESHAAGETYDAVIMNPPFSDRKDALHIQQAYSMLKPGGTLVAIAGEGVFFGSDKKAVEFREWLESQGAETEKLDAGTFNDRTLLATTGANARLITIHKPEGTAVASETELAEDKADLADELMRNPNSDRAKELTAKVHQAHQQQEGPKEGERNDEGLVFRDGRWHREDELDANQSTTTAVDVNKTGNVSDNAQPETSRDDANVWKLSQEEAEAKYPDEGAGRIRRSRIKALLDAYENGEAGAAEAYNEFPDFKPVELMTPDEFIVSNKDTIQADIIHEADKKDEEVKAAAGKWLKTKKEHLQDRHMNSYEALKSEAESIRAAGLDSELAKELAQRRIDLAKHQRSKASAANGPQDGDRNAEGLVFRDGRWHREGDDMAATLQSAGGLPPEPTDADHDAALQRAKDSHDEKMAKLRAKVESMGGARSFGFLLARMMNDAMTSKKADDLINQIAESVGLSREEVLPELGVKPKAARQSKPKATAPVAASATDDDLDPNSPNYRYRDTGDIAGSRKEKAALMLKQAKADGNLVRYTALDWESIEQNPREAKELITKSNLFGLVDWDALKADGMEPGAGFLIDRLYAAVGKEPSEDSAMSRKDYAIGIESLRDRMEKCRTAADVVGTIAELRDEMSGTVYTADETEQHNALFAEFTAIKNKIAELKKPADAAYDAAQSARSAVYQAQREMDNRKRRGWAIKPEHDKALADAKVASDTAGAAWSKAIADAKPLIAEQEELQKVNRAKRVAIESIARERTNMNPIRRAWKALGDKFENAINYRRHNGSQAFANHVATVNAGRVDSWGWADKEPKPATRKGLTNEQVRFQLKVADTYVRTGGRPVSIDSTMALKDQFGLRDVQSGNWVLKDPVSAKFHVEQSAAAMADLADLIGVPDHLVSMNGRLAIAFGARGKGNAGFGGAARAHYEPVHRVMNMTKMGGGGCLGHEWFHAFDNMVKEMSSDTATPAEFFSSTGFAMLPEGELKDAYSNLYKAMSDGNEYHLRRIQYSNKDHRTAKLNVDSGYPNRISQLIKQAGNASDAALAVSQYFSGRDDTRKNKKLKDDWSRIAVAYYGDEAGGITEVKTGNPISSFKKEAALLDEGAMGKYWSAGEEMAARAFQAWCEDSLSAKGLRSDYLSALADNKYHRDPLTGMEWKPFPEGDERKRINAAFDRLFEVVRKQNIMQKALDMMSA